MQLMMLMHLSVANKKCLSSSWPDIDSKLGLIGSNG